MKLKNDTKLIKTELFRKKLEKPTFKVLERHKLQKTATENIVNDNEF